MPACGDTRIRNFPDWVDFVATASKDGVPNVSAKGSIQVIDDDTLAFACIQSQKTMKNLEANPQIAVAMADAKEGKGFQFKGKASLETSGTLFDKMGEMLAKMKMPTPKCVVRITVTETFK